MLEVARSRAVTVLAGFVARIVDEIAAGISGIYTSAEFDVTESPLFK